MAKNVTLVDIANEVGVSNAAVSKALTGKSGVSEELRERIKNVADRMGYKPNNINKEPLDLRTGNIGVIIPEQYYGYALSFYGQLYESVVKALYKNHYYGILELLNVKDEKEVNIPKVMKDEKVDGIIFLGQLDDSYIDFMIQQTELPVFFLDTYRSCGVFDTVISDGYYGTYNLTEYLIRQGHKSIGFVGSVDSTSSIADRYWGYRRALRENGIKYEDFMEISDRDEYGRSYDSLQLYPDKMDAFVCNSDITAHCVIQNLEESGYRVPDDISVVGFDNYSPIGMDTDKITSYEVDMKRMAEICVKSLISKINGHEYVEGVQIITGKIIYKKSVIKRKN